MSDLHITYTGGHFILNKSFTGDGLPVSYMGVELPIAPIIPQDSQEVYDMLMAQIEPELTTQMLPLLDQKYVSETPEEAEERAKRYSKAFEEYEIRLSSYIADLQRTAIHYQKEAVSALEKGDHITDESLLEVQLAAITDDSNQETQLHSQLAV